MTKHEFAALLQKLGEAWTRRDYDAVCAAFAADVRYGDPLRYSFHGLTELRGFFDATTSASESCVFHAVVFDEEQQLGAAEYTYKGENQYHGLVLIRVRDERITHWREYQHVDARDWTSFVAATAMPLN